MFHKMSPQKLYLLIKRSTTPSNFCKDAVDFNYIYTYIFVNSFSVNFFKYFKKSPFQIRRKTAFPGSSRV